MYTIRVNGRFLGRCIANRVAAQTWVRENVRSAHMGEWIRIPGGIEYATTIGRYYSFELNS